MYQNVSTTSWTNIQGQKNKCDYPSFIKKRTLGQMVIEFEAGQLDSVRICDASLKQTEMWKLRVETRDLIPRKIYCSSLPRSNRGSIYYVTCMCASLTGRKKWWQDSKREEGKAPWQLFSLLSFLKKYWPSLKNIAQRQQTKTVLRTDLSCCSLQLQIPQITAMQLLHDESNKAVTSKQVWLMLSPRWTWKA